MCNDPNIVNYSLEELLKLDNGTSQWASAAILLGNKERIEDPPFKLQLTYDAVEHWENKRLNDECWEPKYDETILRQAKAYLGLERFIAQQAEDYCFARAFGLISPEEGEKRWPSLKSHESNRIEEMEKALQQTGITSKDHRVVQAITMLKGDKVKIKYPNSVNKSWPQFWEFLEDKKIKN